MFGAVLSNGHWLKNAAIMAQAMAVSLVQLSQHTGAWLQHCYSIVSAPQGCSTAVMHVVGASESHGLSQFQRSDHTMTASQRQNVYSFEWHILAELRCR
jgi:hypothetical protein